MIAALIVSAFLITILFLPFASELSYSPSGLRVSVKLFKIPIYIYPKRNKPEKKKSEKKLKLKDKLELAKIIIRTLRRTKHNIETDTLKLRFISAGDDPYDVVMRYNSINAIAGLFYPVLHPKNSDIVIGADFEAEKSELSAFILLKIRFVHLLRSAPAAAVDILKLLIKQRTKANGKQTQ